GAAAAAPRGIGAPKDDQLGVPEVQPIVDGELGRSAGHADDVAGMQPGPVGARPPAGHVTSGRGQGALDLAPTGHEDGTVAVLLTNSPNLTGDDVQSLIPRDADPLVLPTEILAAAARLPVLPHHRVLE